MAAVGYRVRSELRRGWRGLLTIALVVGLAGGASLGAVGAARRTGSAYARMRAATNAWDVQVSPNLGSQSQLRVADIRRLPGVETAGEVQGYLLYPSFAKSLDQATNFPSVLSADDTATYRLGRPLMTSGYEPRPSDPDGVWLDRTFADSMHLRVGQTFTYTVVTFSLLEKIISQPTIAKSEAAMADAPKNLKGHARIDGIGLTSDALVVDQGSPPSSVNFTPAFFSQHDRPASEYWEALVKLKPGTSADAFAAEVQRLVPHESLAVLRAASVTAQVDDATGPQTVALDAFAALAALLGLVVVSQAMSRRLLVEARHNATLAALGSTRRQRLAVSMVEMVLAVAVGSVLALVIAVAVSPLAPVGAIRPAEIHPGVSMDWVVLGGGLAAVLVLGGLLALVPAWRASRVVADPPSLPRPGVAGRLAALGASLTAVVGVRFALERGSERNGAPVRTTLLAAVTAVALVASVAVFSASADHLVATPRLFGSPWDAEISLNQLNNVGNGPNDPRQLVLEEHFADLADHSGAVAASSVLRVGSVRAGNVAIPALGLVAHRSHVSPTIAAGRLPRTPTEIALGQTTMTRLHTDVGGTIRLAPTAGGPDQDVRVVGRVVFPAMGNPGSDGAGLGVGALMIESGWTRFSRTYDTVNYVFRWKAGASVATLDRYIGRVDPHDLPLDVNGVTRPAGVLSVERLRATPTLLAMLVAVLLAAAVANALVVAVRRRRHDLAVLRTLGFTTGQVLRSVLWQATAVAVVALGIGVPVGLIAGRWAWTLLARQMGTIPDPLVSVDVLVLVIVAVLVGTNLVGVIPGLRAARAPGRALRSE